MQDDKYPSAPTSNLSFADFLPVQRTGLFRIPNGSQPIQEPQPPNSGTGGTAASYDALEEQIAIYEEKIYKNNLAIESLTNQLALSKTKLAETEALLKSVSEQVQGHHKRNEELIAQIVDRFKANINDQIYSSLGSRPDPELVKALKKELALLLLREPIDIRDPTFVWALKVDAERLASLIEPPFAVKSS